MSHGVVLFRASTRSRQEAEDLAAEAWRLRPDVKIFFRPPDGVAYGAATPGSDPRQLELDLGPEPPARRPPMTLRRDAGSPSFQRPWWPTVAPIARVS